MRRHSLAKIMKAFGGLGILPARRLGHAFCFFSRGFVNNWGSNISLLDPATAAPVVAVVVVVVETGGCISTSKRALPNSDGEPTVQ